MDESDEVQPQPLGTGDERKAYDDCLELFKRERDLQRRVANKQLDIDIENRKTRPNRYTLRRLRGELRNLKQQHDQAKDEFDRQCKEQAEKKSWTFSEKAAYETKETAEGEFTELADVAEDLQVNEEGLPPTRYPSVMEDTQDEIATDL